jgi:MFS family permease
MLSRYICETTPPRWRGILAGTVQVLICTGIMVGYFMCYGTVNLKSSLAWRFPLAFQAGYALFFAAISYFYLPQSPRWLAFKGRGPEATAVWDKLGVSSTEREKDLEERPMLRSEAVEATGTAKTGIFERIRQSMANFMAMFGKLTRKQMLLGVFMMSMQQLSGIDGVLYVSIKTFTKHTPKPLQTINNWKYAPLLFQQAGISSSEAAFLASGISAILICVSTVIAFMLVDKWSRRASTIYGGILIFACMLLMGMLYATNSVHADYGIGRWVVIVTIYIFAVTYAMSKPSPHHKPFNKVLTINHSMGPRRKALRERDPTHRHTRNSNQLGAKRKLRNKLLCGVHNPSPARLLEFRYLFPFRQLCLRDRCYLRDLYA